MSIVPHRYNLRDKIKTKDGRSGVIKEVMLVRRLESIGYRVLPKEGRIFFVLEEDVVGRE